MYIDNIRDSVESKKYVILTKAHPLLILAYGDHDCLGKKKKKKSIVIYVHICDLIKWNETHVGCGQK